MSILRKSIFGTAIAATALASATPALADDYRRHRGGDDTAAIAIGAGVIGLALGAIIASSDNDRRDDRYYRSSYGYEYGPAYTGNWSYRDGYYWDRDGRRYNRDQYNRYQREDRRRGYGRDRSDYRRGY